MKEPSSTKTPTFAKFSPYVKPQSNLTRGQLKDLFDLEHLSCKGLENVRALTCFSVLAYVLLVILNIRNQQPPTRLKAVMLALR